MLARLELGTLQSEQNSRWRRGHRKPLRHCAVTIIRIRRCRSIDLRNRFEIEGYTSRFARVLDWMVKNLYHRFVSMFGCGVETDRRPTSRKNPHQRPRRAGSMIQSLFHQSQTRGARMVLHLRSPLWNPLKNPRRSLWRKESIPEPTVRGRCRQNVKTKSVPQRIARMRCMPKRQS